jgi:hypothetical protein
MSARKHTRTWSRPVIECLNPLIYLDSTLTADFDGNHRVDTADFTVLAVNFNGTNKTHAQGDANLDTRVNAQDFNVLADEFGRVEMSKTWDDDAVDEDIANPVNFNPDGLPSSTDDVIFPNDSIGGLTNSSGAQTWKSVTCNNGGANSFDFLSLISIVNDAAMSGTSGGTLAGLGGNLTGTGNTELPRASPLVMIPSH